MASQIDYDQHFDEYIRRIKVLNERIWENRVNQIVIDRWLENFTGAIEPVQIERLYALHLLSNFMYFGSREMRELLKSLYRDHLSYPMLRSIRLANGGTTNLSILEPELLIRLRCTRFLGMGNPSESGTHLLYSFRQENGLSKTLFINTHEIFNYDPSGTVALANTNIEHYVFLDDLAGSGTQARQYSTSVVALLKALKKDVVVSYFVLFATAEGLKTIRDNTNFDNVQAVFELDETFYCFGPKSRYYPDGYALDLPTAERILGYYGSRLWPSFPLGFDDCQLLLGFHHNTPDNTLPVIWHVGQQEDWVPAFRRYPKSAW